MNVTTKITLAIKIMGLLLGLFSLALKANIILPKGSWSSIHASKLLGQGHHFVYSTRDKDFKGIIFTTEIKNKLSEKKFCDTSLSSRIKKYSPNSKKSVCEYVTANNHSKTKNFQINIKEENIISSLNFSIKEKDENKFRPYWNEIVAQNTKK